MADDKPADNQGDGVNAMRQIASTGELVENEGASSQAADSKQPTMELKVYAPFKVYYEGKATSLTATNESGPFDILPHHHNFLCMLLPGDLTIRTPFDIKTVKVSRALLHVSEDKVTVFVDV